MLQVPLGQSKTSWWMARAAPTDPPRKPGSLDSQGSAHDEWTHAWGADAHPPQSVVVRCGCASTSVGGGERCRLPAGRNHRRHVECEVPRIHVRAEFEAANAASTMVKATKVRAVTSTKMARSKSPTKMKQIA